MAAVRYVGLLCASGAKWCYVGASSQDDEARCVVEWCSSDLYMTIQARNFKALQSRVRKLWVKLAMTFIDYL